MLRFGKTKVAKTEFDIAKKKTAKIWDADVDRIIISKLTEMNYNSKYMIDCLADVIRPLGLILLKLKDMLKDLKMRIRNLCLCV